MCSRGFRGCPKYMRRPELPSPKLGQREQASGSRRADLLSQKCLKRSRRFRFAFQRPGKNYIRNNALGRRPEGL